MIKMSLTNVLLFCSLIAAQSLVAQNLTVLGGTTFLIEASTDVNVVGNINVQSAGSIDNSGIVSLTGNWTNNGNGLVNLSQGTVVFNGNTNQNIAGSASTTFYNLTVDNPVGVTIGTNQNVASLLDFDNGKITTGSNTINLTANPPVPISGANTARYVNGNLQVAFPGSGNSTVKYEIGNSTTYAPVTLELTGITSQGSIRALTASGVSPNENNPVANASQIDPSARADQHWITTNNGVTFATSKATFDYSNTSNTGDESAYKVAQFSNNTWTLPPSTVNGTTVKATGITTLSGEFQVGEQTPDAVEEISSGVIGSVQVFPIPASDNMTVQFYSAVNDVFNICLIDMTGRTVVAHQKNAGRGVNRQELDVESLADGMYLVTIQGAGSRHTTHVLVK
ncbi:MAG: T9SS type A sorting domain-containing protein [Crocinitomicaceae bacterium]|nr:T9SS type A sorting domain-containing protein [Crocinitomicaceae bacterium]